MTDALPPRTYPAGVPCWIDLETTDPDAVRPFYSGLLGWTLTDAMPPDAPGHYLVAELDGADVGAIAAGAAVLGAPGAWNTYIAVDDADAAAAAVERAGGDVVEAPVDTPGGRAAVCRDPQGAVFRLWQAGRRIGSQAVNRPGGWGFSDLRTPDLESAQAFYAGVFGWRFEDMGFGTRFALVPGYGDHLAAGADPEIHERQRRVGTSEWFADVVARLEPVDGEAAWRVTFGVADADRSAGQVGELGGRVVGRGGNPWQHLVEAEDPQGAAFTLSQFVG